MPLVNMPFEENDKPKGTRTVFPDPEKDLYEFYDAQGLILGIYKSADETIYGRPKGTKRVEFNEETKITTFFGNKNVILGSYDEDAKQLTYLKPQKHVKLQKNK